MGTSRLRQSYPLPREQWTLPCLDAAPLTATWTQGGLLAGGGAKSMCRPLRRLRRGLASPSKV